MDPELLQLLFQNARNNNKNVSGVLNNLDSPFLAYLANALDPMTQVDSGGGGSLFAQYENYDQPAVQDVLAQIRNGVDKYWLSSYIDSNISDEDIVASGFQPDDFKGLASALQEDYQKGNQRKDVFSKAGLPSPLDVYDESNMPLEAPLANFLGKFSSESERIGGLAQKAQKDVGSGRNRVDVAKNAMKEYAEKLRRGGTGGVPDMALRRLSEDVAGRDMVTDTEWAELVEKYSPKNTGYSYGGYEKRYRERLAGAGKVPKISKKEMDSLSSSERQANDLMYLAKDAKANEDMVRKAFLAKIQESGKTPLGDSLAAMMRFTANTSGK